MILSVSKHTCSIAALASESITKAAEISEISVSLISLSASAPIVAHIKTAFEQPSR